MARPIIGAYAKPAQPKVCITGYLDGIEPVIGPRILVINAVLNQNTVKFLGYFTWIKT